MSDAIEDKISLFTKLIIERIENDFQNKKNILLENHKNRVKNIINDYEEKKRTAIDKVSKETGSRKQHLIFKTRSSMRLEVLKKRKELMERISEEIRERVKTFIKTDQYSDFLKEVIKKVSSKFTPDQFLYYKFSPHDVNNRSGMILNTIDSLKKKETYQIDTEAHLIGGLFVRERDGRLEIDYTINTILDESHKLIGEVLFSYLNRYKDSRDKENQDVRNG